MAADSKRSAYEPREVATELRQAAWQQYGWETTTDEDLDGSKEWKVEYRAAIVIEQQASRIDVLEATLRSVAGVEQLKEARELAVAALDADGYVPNLIATEDCDLVWIEESPITRTALQVAAALRVHGMIHMDGDTEYSYEVNGREWLVPTDAKTETPLLTHSAVTALEQSAGFYDERIVWMASEVADCETGAWWWRCEEKITEPSDRG